MATRLSPDDYALLDELKTRPRRIRAPKPRDGADRLVEAGYATSRSLNMSDVEYEITPLGKIARVLKDFGVHTTQYSVEPHQHDVDGQWYLKVTSEGNPAFLMPIGSATKLMDHLRAAGADDLANELERQIDRARWYALG
jgi:hypothetical protein